VTLALAACLGAAVVALPAIAGSEGVPTIAAAERSGVYGYHYWSPSTAKIAPGGTITIENASMTVRHGVQWIGAKPTCESSVPVGTTEAAAGTNWKGNCTFATAGTYTFYCTVHGAEMTGHVYVEAGGTTTTTPPPGTTPTTPSPVGPPAGGGGAGASPFAGAASSSVALSSVLHGHGVRGSVAVSQTGAGGTLKVQVLAARAALARAGAAALLVVGHYSRSALPAGTVRFAVPLDHGALGALRRRHHLSLTVRLALTPAGGTATTVSKRLLLRP
jgi:plastocyanin